MSKMTFSRSLRSELVRLRCSSLAPLHLVIAVVLGGCAGAYFSYATWDSLLGTDAFFQLLGSGAPLLVGISSGLALDAEREAGGYVNLLGVPSRRLALAAKGTALLALGLAAALVATLLFFAMLVAAGREVVPLAACVAAALGIALGSAVLYAAFMWIALRFGRNAAIGVGVLGFGAAVMSMGGLANGLVTGTLSGSFGIDAAAFIPFSWPSRFASLAIESAIVGSSSTGASMGGVLVAALEQIGLVCGVVTVGLVALLLVCANSFEDRRREGE